MPLSVLLSRKLIGPFDPIWKSGQRSRSDAYSWLAHNLGIKKRDCHIGLFDIVMCRKVVEVCKQIS